jgi:hypothetical protein
MVIGVLPTSGLLIGAPSDVVKAIGLISSVLAALGYTANRTSLKRAYLATSPAKISLPGGTAVLALVLALSTAGVAITTPGCAAATQAATCTLATLETEVGNQTLAAQVEAALLSDNYLAALTDLGVKAGVDAVNCVLTAIRDLASGELAAGSAGSAAPAVVPSRTQLLRDRAVLVLKARGGK